MVVSLGLSVTGNFVNATRSGPCSALVCASRLRTSPRCRSRPLPG
ncbi:hypothetical protein ACSHXN_45190 (plasmid) [Streptomyces sp. HUAS TT11]